MECIVLAGGTPRPGQPLYEVARGRPKALLQIAGRPMIEYVLEALRGCDAVGRIIVVGVTPEQGYEPPPDVVAVPGCGSLTANLYAGIERLSSDGIAAYCWSDIPLLTAGDIERFLAAMPARDFDVCAGLVPRACLQGAYPEFQDTWLRLRDGEFVAADLGLFRPRHAQRLRPQLEKLAPLRKSAVRQALTVGVPLLLRHLAGRLTIAGLERSLRRRFGVECVVRVVEQAEIGLDVDRPQDLALVRAVLSARGA